METTTASHSPQPVGTLLTAPVEEDAMHLYGNYTYKDQLDLRAASRIYRLGSGEKLVVVGEPLQVTFQDGTAMAQPCMTYANWRRNYSATADFSSIPPRARFRHWLRLA